MNVCICGSMSVIDEIESLAGRLRADGHDVVTPDRSELDDGWDALTLAQQVQAKRGFIDNYLAKIRLADAVVVANFTKNNTVGNNTAGYVGANTLIEAAFAKALGIPVYLVEEPGHQPCQVEVLALRTATDSTGPLNLAAR